MRRRSISSRQSCLQAEKSIFQALSPPRSARRGRQFPRSNISAAPDCRRWMMVGDGRRSTSLPRRPRTIKSAHPRPRPRSHDSVRTQPHDSGRPHGVDVPRLRPCSALPRHMGASVCTRFTGQTSVPGGSLRRPLRTRSGRLGLAHARRTLPNETRHLRVPPLPAPDALWVVGSLRPPGSEPGATRCRSRSTRASSSRHRARSARSTTACRRSG